MEVNSQANEGAALNIEVPSCSICFNEYGSGIRKPWDLGCGHCICGRCFASLSFSGPKVCPVDRSEWNNPHPAYEFLHVVEQLQKIRGDTGKLADADDELLPEPLRAHLRTTGSRFSWRVPDPFRPAANALLLLSDVWRALFWRPGLTGSPPGAGLATDMGVREALGHIAIALPPWVHTVWRMVAPSLLVTLVTMGWRYVAAVTMLVLPMFVAATITMEVDFQPHSWPMVLACIAAGSFGSASVLDPLLAFGLLQPLLAALLLTVLAAGIHHARVCNCDIALIARQRTVQVMVGACAFGIWASGLPAATRWFHMRRLLLLFGQDLPADRATMANFVVQAIAAGSGTTFTWPLSAFEDLAFWAGTRIVAAIVGVADVQPVLGRWKALGMLCRAVAAPVVLMFAVSCLNQVRSSLPAGGPAVLPGARPNGAAVTRYDLDWLLLRLVVAVGVLVATGSLWLAATANVALHGCFLLLRLVSVNRRLLRMFRDESDVASALNVMNISSSTNTNTNNTNNTSSTSHSADIRSSLRRRVRAVRLNTSSTAPAAATAADVLTNHETFESSPRNLLFSTAAAIAATVPNTPNAAAISVLSEPVTGTAATESAQRYPTAQQSTTASLPSSSTSSLSIEFDVLTKLLELDALSQDRDGPVRATAHPVDGAAERDEQRAVQEDAGEPLQHPPQEQEDLHGQQAIGSAVQQQAQPWRHDGGLQDQVAPCGSSGDGGERQLDRQEKGSQFLVLRGDGLLEASGPTGGLQAGESDTAGMELASPGAGNHAHGVESPVVRGQLAEQGEAVPCSEAGRDKNEALVGESTGPPHGPESRRDVDGMEACAVSSNRDPLCWVATSPRAAGAGKSSSSSSTGAVHLHGGAVADANIGYVRNEPSCSEPVGGGVEDVATGPFTAAGGSEELLASCSLQLSNRNLQLDRGDATGELRDLFSEGTPSATRCSQSGDVEASGGEGSGPCRARWSEAATREEQEQEQEQAAVSGPEYSPSGWGTEATRHALRTDAEETGATLPHSDGTAVVQPSTASTSDAPSVAEAATNTNTNTDRSRSSDAVADVSNGSTGSGSLQSARRVVVRDLLATSLTSSSTRLRFRITAVRAAREGATATASSAHTATTAAAAATAAGATPVTGAQRPSAGASRRRGRSDGSTASALGSSGSQRGSQPPQPRGGMFDDFVWTSTVMLLAEWLVCVPPWSDAVEAVDGWMGPMQPVWFIRCAVGILGLGLLIKLVRLMATHTPEDALRPITVMRAEDGGGGPYLVRVPVRYHLGMAAVPAVCLLLRVLWRPLAALHLGFVSGLELVLRLTVAASMTGERRQRRSSLPLSSTPPVLFAGMFLFERPRRADASRRHRAGMGATEIANGGAPLDTSSDGAGGNEGAQSAHATRRQRLELGIEMTAAALGLDWPLAHLLSRLPATIMGVRERRRLPIVVYP